MDRIEGMNVVDRILIFGTLSTILGITQILFFGKCYAFNNIYFWILQFAGGFAEAITLRTWFLFTAEVLEEIYDHPYKLCIYGLTLLTFFYVLIF